MSTIYQIVSSEHVYFSLGRRLPFGDVMTRISTAFARSRNSGGPILPPSYLTDFSLALLILQTEDTFHILFRSLAEKWDEHDDVVNPFGDIRQAAMTAYTFDLTKDILVLSDASQNQQLPLKFFRQHDCPTLAEFTPVEVPSPPELNSSAFPPPYWDPRSPVTERNLVFVERIFSDFNFQWRHVLRRTYADITFRKLARAILDIAVLDFNVVEITGMVHANSRGLYVSNVQLPSWKPCGKHIILGRTIVVLDQDLENALALTKQHVREELASIKTGSHKSEDRSNIYLLLSVRHVMLCRVDRYGNLLYCAPSPFLNGIDTPPLAATTLILQAFAFSSPPLPRTRIHDLPIEIQDRILEGVSEGPIEAARLGCMLGLGTPFTWMRSKDWPRRQGSIERHLCFTHRHNVSPVESQIHFGKTFSGVAYK